MRQWYNFTTFDIIGDLAFGEPFGMLENARYDSWVELITESMKSLIVLAAFRYMGLETVLAPFLWFVQRARREQLHRVKEKLERRMALDVERPDFIEGLLKKKDEWVREQYLHQLHVPDIRTDGCSNTRTSASTVSAPTPTRSS